MNIFKKLFKVKISVIGVFYLFFLPISPSCNDSLIKETLKQFVRGKNSIYKCNYDRKF